MIAEGACQRWRIVFQVICIMNDLVTVMKKIVRPLKVWLDPLLLIKCFSFRFLSLCIIYFPFH